jgi:hypothetical protein
MADVLSLIVQVDETHWLQMVSWIASALGFLVAAVGLVVSAIANNADRKVRRQTFWLDIRKMFADHDEVHKKLQKGGPWYQSDTEPSDPQDRAQVMAYLSLLEQVKFMLNRGLIDEDTIDATLLPYRVRLILQNGPIKRGLLHGEHKDENPDWELFKELVKDFDRRYGKKDNFNYRDMLNSRQGGGPETALRDSGKRERENDNVDRQEGSPNCT